MAEFLYIHIPFCIRKCAYCDFLSIPYDEALALRYIDALCRELGLKKGQAASLKGVFIGGGTPSTLPAACFEKLFAGIRKNYSLAPSAEITVEANPGSISKAKIAVLLSLGVNRLSLGVQSFQDSELKTLGRIHNADEALRSAEVIRSAGLENLSLDLIYGIPGQTITTWRASLDTAISLSPKHISAYELTPEKSTPLTRLLESGEITLPAEELILDMSSLAIDHLAASGYEHYEISNFALSGYCCIHNLNYWDRGEYLAAGAGAHSFIKGCRSGNTNNVGEYIERLSRGRLPEAESVGITREDARREFIFLGLRKIRGIRLQDADELGLKIPEAASALVGEGLMTIADSRVRLTRKGLPIANTVIAALIESLGL